MEGIDLLTDYSMAQQTGSNLKGYTPDRLHVTEPLPYEEQILDVEILKIINQQYRRLVERKWEMDWWPCTWGQVESGNQGIAGTSGSQDRDNFKHVWFKLQTCKTCGGAGRTDEARTHSTETSSVVMTKNSESTESSSVVMADSTGSAESSKAWSPDTVPLGWTSMSFIMTLLAGPKFYTVVTVTLAAHCQVWWPWLGGHDL